MDLVISWISSHLIQIFAGFVLALCAWIGEGADWRPRDADSQINLAFVRFDFNFKIWTGALLGAIACWVIILLDWDPNKPWLLSTAGKNNFWLMLSQFLSILLVVWSIPARYMWGAVMFVLGTGLFVAVWKLVVVTSFGLR